MRNGGHVSRNINVARENYRGIDAQARYQLTFAGEQTLSLVGSAAYLESDQLLREGLPQQPLAGRLFKSPHLRSRVGAVWRQGPVTLASYASYSGSVTDRQRVAPVHISSVTTLDLTGRLEIAGGLEVAVSALNVFNAKPDVIYTTSVSAVTYDTTNYSALGRFVGISLSKAW